MINMSVIAEDFVWGDIPLNIYHQTISLKNIYHQIVRKIAGTEDSGQTCYGSTQDIWKWRDPFENCVRNLEI